MTGRQRLWIFVAGAAGLVAFLLWGLAGLPAFGHYPGPYGDIINRVAVAQTNATGVVSAVNFEYRGFDTLGEEFILFAAAAGIATVLRRLRGEHVITTRRAGLDRVAPPAPSSSLAGSWPRTRRPARPAGSRAASCSPPRSC